MSLPRYPEYKDSGVEWLGEVPAHWRVVPLGRVTRSRCDGPFGSGLKSEHYTDNGVRVVRLQNIRRDGFDGTDEAFVDLSYYRAELTGHDVVAGDVLIAGLGDDNNTVGRACVAPNGIEPAMVKADCFRFRLNQDEVHTAFVAVALTATATLDAGRLSTGSTRSRIPLSVMATRKLALPPLAEQAHIAEFLDRETAKIAALVAEQQRLIELLKEKRQAVIYHAVTKGLNPNAAMKDSGIEWLGEVPAHWEVERLKHISPSITVGIVVNPSTYVSDAGRPFIYGGDIREGSIDWVNSRRIELASSEANAKTQLRPGDLVTVRVGAPGVTAVVPAECDGGNCASVMLIRGGQYNSDWLCYAMNTRLVRFQVEVVQYGAAQEQFNISHAVNFWVPTPPHAEQNEIASFLRAQTLELDDLTTEATRAIDLLQERRTALISAAVTGQIDVRPRAQKT